MMKTNKTLTASLIPSERIEQIILIVRSQKVILDSDLASLYGVETGALNRAVKRNATRFPENFAFRLNDDEVEVLRCQFGIAKFSKKLRYLPYVFTEHGALMAATVLNSEGAVSMSLAIINTFIKLREMLSVNKDLSHRLDELEKTYDMQFQFVFDEIRKLMALPKEKSKRIVGFAG